ncbi:MAG: MBOAT family protein [Alphaproteobacteria bacterium]|nr:MBOAT family protein [Alphaproteobacteria bacterium]
MLQLDQLGFWALVVLVAVLVRAFGLTGRWRAAVYLLAAAALFSGAPLLGLLLLGVCAYGYVALRVLAGPWGIAVHTLVMSAAFVLSQHPDVIPGPQPFLRLFPLVGLPYVYLRVLHLIADVKNGVQPVPDALEYFTYVLPFHQVIAGPVERFPAFRAALHAPLAPLDLDTFLLAVARIVNGFLKKAVLAEILRDGVGFGFDGHGLRLLAEIDLHALFIYLDFSGYMDIVIGAGVLIGWKPPENFDWPYGSRNLIEFWTRWHITLGEFIRDYLFNPLNLYLQRGPLRGRVLTAGVVSYFVAMAWCGLWHRANLPFLLWGALHGAGIAAVKLWEAGLKKALGKQRMKQYRASRWAGAVATFVTFQFVAVSFLFAFETPARALEILWNLF